LFDHPFPELGFVVGVAAACWSRWRKVRDSGTRFLEVVSQNGLKPSELIAVNQGFSQVAGESGPFFGGPVVED
jgi:hypothetical protein